MMQKYRDNIWYSPQKISDRGLQELDIIEMFTINKIITERQIIYEQVNLSNFFPRILTYLPLAQN